MRSLKYYNSFYYRINKPETSLIIRLTSGLLYYVVIKITTAFYKRFYTFYSQLSTISHKIIASISCVDTYLLVILIIIVYSSSNHTIKIQLIVVHKWNSKKSAVNGSQWGKKTGLWYCSDNRVGYVSMAIHWFRFYK